MLSGRAGPTSSCGLVKKACPRWRKPHEPHSTVSACMRPARLGSRAAGAPGAAGESGRRSCLAPGPHAATTPTSDAQPGRPGRRALLARRAHRVRARVHARARLRDELLVHERGRVERDVGLAQQRQLPVGRVAQRGAQQRLGRVHERVAAPGRIQVRGHLAPVEQRAAREAWARMGRDSGSAGPARPARAALLRPLPGLACSSRARAAASSVVPAASISAGSPRHVGACWH